MGPWIMQEILLVCTKWNDDAPGIGLLKVMGVSVCVGLVVRII